MRERNRQDQTAQELDYFEWTANPKNQRAIGIAWSEEWKREYWTKDEPEVLLTPSEQAKVDSYYPRIIDAIEARIDRDGHIANEAARQRAVSNWEGVSTFLQLYYGTVGEDRTATIRAMGKVIENAEQNPETSAQVLYLVTNMSLTQVEGSVKRLSIVNPKQND